MTSRDYQMITVYDYVKMLDGDIKYIDNNTRELRKNVAKIFVKILGGHKLMLEFLEELLA